MTKRITASFKPEPEVKYLIERYGEQIGIPNAEVLRQCVDFALDAIAKGELKLHASRYLRSDSKKIWEVRRSGKQNEFEETV